MINRRRRAFGVMGFLAVVTATALSATGADAAATAKPVTWHQVKSPNPKGGSNYLDAVSCPRADACVAVGETATSPLVLASRHGRWTRERVKAKGSAATLQSVSCASPTSCLAVGFSDNGALALRYDGKRWSPTHPVQPSSNGGSLNAVTCPSKHVCWIAGQDASKSLAYVPFVEEYHHGHWTRRPVPTLGHGGVMDAISCLSGRDCWAVGQEWSSPDSANADPLVDHWNGHHWTPVEHEGLGKNSELFGVSCVTAHDCYAAGNVAHPPGTLAGRPFIEHYDGTSWTITVRLKHFAQGVNMTGISCVGSGWCAAVGEVIANASGDVENYIVEGRGKTWHLARATQPETAPATTAVSCAAKRKCDAVGAFAPDDSSRSSTMVLVRR